VLENQLREIPQLKSGIVLSSVIVPLPPPIHTTQSSGSASSPGTHGPLPARRSHRKMPQNAVFLQMNLASSFCQRLDFEVGELRQNGNSAEPFSKRRSAPLQRQKV
jgi:hypothetical protein